MTDKIKELEKQVKDSRFVQEEEKKSFEQRMKEGLQTQADVEQELELLARTKEEV